MCCLTTNPLQWNNILVCHLLAICWIYHVFLDNLLHAFHGDNISSTKMAKNIHCKYSRKSKLASVTS